MPNGTIGEKQKLKTHVGMARGPARRWVRQKTRVWGNHIVLKFCIGDRLPTSFMQT